MKTLFMLERAEGQGKRHWVEAVDRLLPDSAGLHYVPGSRRVITEKIDGANMQINLKTGEIGARNHVCMTNAPGDAYYFEAGVPVLGAAQQRFFLSSAFGYPNLILFGELVGSKVNGSGALYDERQFVLFDVLGLDEVREPHFFRWEAVQELAAALRIPTVPELTATAGFYDDNRFDFEMVRDYVLNLESAVRPGHGGRERPAEGIVIRDADDTSWIRRRIAKIRRKDFRG